MPKSRFQRMDLSVALARFVLLTWLGSVQAQPSPPPDTRVWKDLAYVKDGHERQKLDLYVPKGEGSRPLIVSIHGGAFRMGSKTDGVPWECLKQGYAVASINYHQSVLLEAALRQAGGAVTFYTVRGGGHGGFRDPQVNRLTQEFLARHLSVATGAPVRPPEAKAGIGRQTPAFPGAEGFGRLARGGRGGDVYHVTNLQDAGPGSLREGFHSASGPRTIVFDVSGTIELRKKLVLDKSCITIAGQTAPGDGITLKDFTFQIARATNVVVRYLRVRLGDEHKAVGAKGGDDTLNTEDIDHVILDHCSLSWAIDGTHDLRRGGNVTVQWCIISEALNQSLHGKGDHAMAASYRDLSGNITLHHNLFATCRDRHPTLGSAQQPPAYVVDFRNNVIYNWSAGGTANFCDHFINAISNIWRPGPMTDVARLPIAMKGCLPDMGRGYMEGNVFVGREDLTRDNYAALDFQRWLQPPSKYLYRGSVRDWKAASSPVLGQDLPRTETAWQAWESVLDRAGASLRRDAVDVRVIADARAGRGKLINSPAEVGGWPVLRSAAVPLDTDGDGMPDVWERDHGLNPSDAADRNGDRDGDGYTNLEEYLQSLCSG